MNNKGLVTGFMINLALIRTNILGYCEYQYVVMDTVPSPVNLSIVILGHNARMGDQSGRIDSQKS